MFFVKSSKPISEFARLGSCRRWDYGGEGGGGGKLTDFSFVDDLGEEEVWF